MKVNIKDLVGVQRTFSIKLDGVKQELDNQFFRDIRKLIIYLYRAPYNTSVKIQLVSLMWECVRGMPFEKVILPAFKHDKELWEKSLKYTADYHMSGRIEFIALTAAKARSVCLKDIRTVSKIVAKFHPRYKKSLLTI